MTETPSSLPDQRRSLPHGPRGARAPLLSRTAARTRAATRTTPGFLATCLAGLLALQALFLAGLVAAQAVPDRPIVAALATAVGEGTYGPAYLDDGVGGQADRFTECAVVGYGITSPDDARGVVERAVFGPRLESCELGADQITTLAAGGSVEVGAPYYRYWNGYSVVTRPALALWGLTGLRLVSAALLALAGLAAFTAVRRGAGTPAALAVVVPVVVASNAMTTPGTASSHALALAAIGAGVALTAATARRGWRGAVVGAGLAAALLNYVDLLTTPAMGWALCAAVAGAVTARTGTSAVRVLGVTVAAGAAWPVAYGVTWVSRWVIAAAAFGPGVLSSVAEVGAFRLQGDNPAVLDVLGAPTRANLRTWLWQTPTAWSLLAVVAVVVVVGAALALVRRGPGGLAVLAVVAAPAAVVPAWYEVMSNHSQIHAFFTYASLPAAAGVVALAAVVASTPRSRRAASVRAYDTREVDRGRAARAGRGRGAAGRPVAGSAGDGTSGGTGGSGARASGHEAGRSGADGVGHPARDPAGVPAPPTRAGERARRAHAAR